uniref:Uncharacterized protein n=1 Tax=Rhizophora mucronata TaxID=61149 RepID=A0A2P2ILA3_RHIMU
MTLCSNMGEMLESSVALGCDKQRGHSWCEYRFSYGVVTLGLFV